MKIRGLSKSVMSKERWVARGASFVAKLKATKVVWFPPQPVETGRDTAATAKKASESATKKATSAGKKTTSGTKN